MAQVSHVAGLCDDNAKVACAGCGWTGVGLALAPIFDFEKRVRAGEICPAGQCPKCGALAYLSENGSLAQPAGSATGRGSPSSRPRAEL
jgi:hypothetical protein